MRVTRDTLIRIAKETAQERAFNDRDIVAAYLTGSLVDQPDPMLGGAADIDLIFVHAAAPMQKRELVKLTPDFHLDIGHRAKAEFKSPRELRGDPWLGYEMFAPMLIYEREKIFDFVQAALRAGNEFEGPAMTLQRCRRLYNHGRQIWIDLSDVEQGGPKEVSKFYKSLFHAVNAIAELSGPPIQERRLLLEFPARAEAASRPNLTAGLFGLIGAGGVGAETLSAWLPQWKEAFLAASGNARVDGRIHAARANYYEKAFKAMLESDHPSAALWPLMQTWTLAAQVLPGEDAAPWLAASTALGLAGGNFAQRVEALDQYLDEVDILLEEFAAANGLDTSA
ncbi:MAG: hypothetical protein ACOY0R_18035 [Chloroflexota bacterium]